MEKSHDEAEDYSEDKEIFLILRDEKCHKIQLIISSESRMTGQDLINHLIGFVENYEENIQEILDTAPKISSH